MWLAQQSQRRERIENFTLPIDKMRLNEVWMECKQRLGIEDKEELYNAVKDIEGSMCVELGLNANPSSINLTRLRAILKLLRRLNIREESEVVDFSQTASQEPS